MACLLSLPAITLAAQEAGDMVYTFRFVAGKDMFYVPWSGNDSELARLEACIATLKDRIIAGEIPIGIDGYCASCATRDENLAVAKVRSNRVKSELITRQGLTEECFVTRNHAGGGDYVTVRIAVPQVQQPAQPPVQEEVKVEPQPVVKEEPAEVSAPVEQPVTTEPAVVADYPESDSNTPCWYIGIEGGVPFAVSAYSSFAMDKTRAGWTAGLFAGYRFNSTFSLEVQAAYGNARLASRSCCPDYWISADGSLYEGAVAGGTGWDWHDLKSRVTIQRYGLQLNVNLLGMAPATRHSRWTMDVSPHVMAYGTQASFQNIADGQTVYEGTTRWHLGVGGNLQVGCLLTRNLGIGIYSGITYLTGMPLDGTPRYLHKANYIWESGLRLSWCFTPGRKEDKR